MNYLYEAVDEQGLPVFGKIEAKTEAEAQRELQQRGLRPQSLAPSGGRGGEGERGRGGEYEISPLLNPQSQYSTPDTQHLTPNTQYPSVQDRLNVNPAMQEVTSIGTVATAPRRFA